METPYYYINHEEYFEYRDENKWDYCITAQSKALRRSTYLLRLYK